ncbi:MAG: type II toxin-antitoxin system RelE/ParE family toxin [Candidatus Sericytochromatia bacterium]|nr:type II toxin-antitoxin system RelE/ParE family toxin [Candidatus Sericytochromatia bacterium]
MIKSTKGKLTALILTGRPVKGVAEDLRRAAYRKLMIISFAPSLERLREPPGNRLEALGGDRKGQHSIRINDQWRICFVWQGVDAHQVEVVDYH